MKRRFSIRRILVFLAVALAVYGLLAYVALPAVWTHYERQPGLADRPMVTRASGDLPGDPLNVGLVGNRADVVRAMHSAGWYPADAITVRSSLEIVGSVLLDRSYDRAPVSPLTYDGRREDLAYERPDGTSARRRHHVRLWQVLDQGTEGRPVWLGSATFDSGVGFSRYTGQVTHHIAPDIDAERAFFMNSLVEARMVEATYQVTGVGPALAGRNGEGDLYFTDGEIWVSRLVADAAPRTARPERLAPPPAVAIKDRVWRTVAGLFGNTAN